MAIICMQAVDLLAFVGFVVGIRHRWVERKMYVDLRECSSICTYCY